MSARFILKRIISEKQAKQPRISLRWIAQRMGVSSARLSEILKYKRPLTEYYIDKLQMALSLSENEVLELRRAILKSEDGEGFGPILEEEVVNKLADWKPYALLCFLGTTIYKRIAENTFSAEAQIEEIAKYLNLQSKEVTTLFDSMMAANLLVWSTNRWVPQLTEATTGYDIPSEARKKGLEADLSLAQEKLNALQASERDFSSMTLAMDPKNFEKAKKFIREFRRRFVRNLEKSDPKAVYQLNLQFFPLTSTKSE